MIIPLSNTEINDKARELIATLEGVTPIDAARILNEASRVVLVENSKPFKSLLNQPVMPINPDFFKKKPRGYIEKNSDIEDFLVSLNPKDSFTQYTQQCLERFGERAPSRSVIGRYFKKRKDQFKQQENK